MTLPHFRCWHFSDMAVRQTKSAVGGRTDIPAPAVVARAIESKSFAGDSILTGAAVLPSHPIAYHARYVMPPGFAFGILMPRDARGSNGSSPKNRTRQSFADCRYCGRAPPAPLSAGTGHRRHLSASEGAPDSRSEARPTEATVIDAVLRPDRSAEELERCASMLEASGEYRVLRRLRSRTVGGLSAGAAIRRGVFVDTETTGLDPETDEIIELAMLSFDYAVDGSYVSPAASFDRLRDPGRTDLGRSVGADRHHGRHGRGQKHRAGRDRLIPGRLSARDSAQFLIRSPILRAVASHVR
jgi:hypothetical protein